MRAPPDLPGLAAPLAAALLAGCAAPGDAPEPGGPAPGPVARAWGLADCAFVIAAVAVEPEALAPHLPEGFRLAPGRLAALPLGPRAALELDAYRCAAGTDLDGSPLEDVAYGSYYATVEAPAELREAGYDATFVKWDFLVTDQARRDVLAAGGLPARAGRAGLALAGAQVAAVLDLEGAGGFRLSGVMTPPGAPGAPLPFMEFTPLAAGGLAVWHARLHDAAIGQGSGVVEVLPGSWVSEVVGQERVPATFLAGTWNLDEADVAWPVAWPR